MLIELSHLHHIPVASLNDETVLGTVEQFVFHQETGELIGCWVRMPGWLFAKRLALSHRDIVSYDPNGLVVRNQDVLVEPSEIRPFQTYAARPAWIGKSVETEAGERLGKVSDLVLNTDLEIIDTLHVTSLFGPDRIIAREEIAKITPDRIIVRNTTAAAKEALAATEASSS